VHSWGHSELQTDGVRWNVAEQIVGVVSCKISFHQHDPSGQRQCISAYACMETMHGLKVEEGAMRGPLNVSRKRMKSAVGAPLVIMEF
jgi:hypothetical protein